MERPNEMKPGFGESAPSDADSEASILEVTARPVWQVAFGKLAYLTRNWVRRRDLIFQAQGYIQVRQRGFEVSKS